MSFGIAKHHCPSFGHGAAGSGLDHLRPGQPKQGPNIPSATLGQSSDLNFGGKIRPELKASSRLPP